jgi:hypothetical protein
LGFGEDAFDVADWQSLTNLVPRCGDLHKLGHVAGDDLITFSIAEGIT